MCEFCLKHGEGKKWYLQVKNYSEDLLSDAQRKSLASQFQDRPEAATQAIAKAEELNRLPRIIRDVVVALLVRRQKKVHYGQVVPLEDVEKIFDITTEIVRVACYCRHSILGKEKRYCYGISLGPSGGLASILRGVERDFSEGPLSAGFEMLTKEQALEAFRQHEREGLCHTVWTFQTPFIGGICNCDRADCWAMRFTISHQVPFMFRAEYIGQVDAAACSGCRECLRQCQFGAVTWSAAEKKVAIDARACYGCGICRSVCTKHAIKLIAREQCRSAATLW